MWPLQYLRSILARSSLRADEIKLWLTGTNQSLVIVYTQAKRGQVSGNVLVLVKSGPISGQRTIVASKFQVLDLSTWRQIRFTNHSVEQL